MKTNNPWVIEHEQLFIRLLGSYKERTNNYSFRTEEIQRMAYSLWVHLQEMNYSEKSVRWIEEAQTIDCFLQGLLKEPVCYWSWYQAAKRCMELTGESYLSLFEEPTPMFANETLRQKAVVEQIERYGIPTSLAPILMAIETEKTWVTIETMIYLHTKNYPLYDDVFRYGGEATYQFIKKAWDRQKQAKAS